MKFVKRLLSKDAHDPKAEALFKAMKSQDEPEVKKLLDSSVSPNCVTYQRLTPLHFCCISGNQTLLELLLDRGAAIDHVSEDGLTPLMRAVYYNHKELVKTLVAAGADVNQVGPRGSTALSIACFRVKPKLISFLLDRKADVTTLSVAQTDGYSALIRPDVLHFVTVLCADKERLKALWIMLRTHHTLPQGLCREMLSYL